MATTLNGRRRQKLYQPWIFLRVLLGQPQHRMRPDYKNATQIAVALFRDRPKLLFASGRILPGYEAHPGGKIATRAECLRVRERGGNGARAAPPHLRRRGRPSARASLTSGFARIIDRRIIAHAGVILLFFFDSPKRLTY